MQTPFSGPPSYDTLARRYSSQPYPEEFYAAKRAQEAKDLGDFVEIHDITGAQPEEYDVLITDVTDRKMRTEISDLMGVEYLAKASEDDANRVSDTGAAFIYGSANRTLFPCVVSYEDRAHWLFFLVDTGSPWTFISEPAAKLLNISKTRQTLVKIAGRPHMVQMSPTSSHFHDINLIGTDFANAYNLSQINDYRDGKAQLLFGRGWKAVRESVH